MDEYSCEERTAERTFIQAKGLKIGSLADLHYASEEFGSLWKEFCAVSEVTAVRAKHNAAYKEKKNAGKGISRLERLYY
jgi:hypothetical protein